MRVGWRPWWRLWALTRLVISQHSKARARSATPENAAYQRAPIQKIKEFEMIGKSSEKLSDRSQILQNNAKYDISDKFSFREFIMFDIKKYQNNWKTCVTNIFHSHEKIHLKVLWVKFLFLDNISSKNHNQIFWKISDKVLPTALKWPRTVGHSFHLTLGWPLKFGTLQNGRVFPD